MTTPQSSDEELATENPYATGIQEMTVLLPISQPADTPAPDGSD